MWGKSGYGEAKICRNFTLHPIVEELFLFVWCCSVFLLSENGIGGPKRCNGANRRSSPFTCSSATLIRNADPCVASWLKIKFSCRKPGQECQGLTTRIRIWNVNHLISFESNVMSPVYFQGSIAFWSIHSRPCI
jgi:hypothetical protein